MTRKAVDENGNVVSIPADMTYRRWEKLRKERGIISGTRAFAEVRRKSAYEELTPEQIESLKEDIRSIGADLSRFSFNTGRQTGLDELNGLIHVRGDVYPDLTNTSARSTMSTKAVLAHEYYGHLRFMPSEYDLGDWRDEMRASYIAVRTAPGLTQKDRADLIVDAYDRAREAGFDFEYSKWAKGVLFGYD